MRGCTNATRGKANKGTRAAHLVRRVHANAADLPTSIQHRRRSQPALGSSVAGTAGVLPRLIVTVVATLQGFSMLPQPITFRPLIRPAAAPCCTLSPRAEAPARNKL